jgi:hypothetical protein
MIYHPVPSLQSSNFATKPKWPFAVLKWRIMEIYPIWGRLVIANEICCCIFSLMQLLVPVHQLLFHCRNQNLKLTKITGFVSHNVKIILDLNRLSKNLIPINTKIYNLKHIILMLWMLSVIFSKYFHLKKTVYGFIYVN